MESLSIKISPSEKAGLKKIAAARKVSVSQLLREGLQTVLREGSGDEGPSCYDLTSRFFEEPEGIGDSGLRDLSTNKERLRSIGKKK